MGPEARTCAAAAAAVPAGPHAAVPKGKRIRRLLLQATKAE